jgi:hypothetical protein
MGELDAESRDLPRSVRAASALTLLLALYAAATAGPGCMVGLFVGPHILIPAVVSAVLAPVLFLSWYGLHLRRHWAKWLLIVVSSVAALAIPIALVRDLMVGNVEGLTAIPWLIPWLIIWLCFALIAFNLSSQSARVWYTK